MRDLSVELSVLSAPIAKRVVIFLIFLYPFNPFFGSDKVKIFLDLPRFSILFDNYLYCF